MKEAILCLWALLLLSGVISTQVLTDTLWSVPQLDGTICFRPGSGIFNMSTSSGTFEPGDGFDLILGEEVFCRDYLSFDLSSLSNSDTSSINQAIIGIYQFQAWGNDQPNTYPIWNVAGGDTHFCVLDHINYGNSLDLGDWTAGDPGDPQTLYTNIGIISDNAIVEYKTMDVTQYIKEDIANGRIHNQYRIRFTIDTDFDGLGDLLTMISGDSPFYRPHLAIQYNDTTSISISPNLLLQLQLTQNYPNPFNSITIIEYVLPVYGQIELTIFDAVGKKIYTLVEKYQSPGSYQIPLNAKNLPTGIYFYRLKFNHQSITRKMLLTR